MAHIPPGWPARSIAECHKIMLAPGQLFEQEDVVINGLTLKAYKHLPVSLKALWATTLAFGDKDYIIYEDERITYNQAHQRIAQYANLLSEGYGLNKGDRVAIACRNIPEWILLFWTAQSLGLVWVSVNAWLTPEVLTFCITNTDAALVLLDDERAKLLQHSMKDLRKGGAKNIAVLCGGQKRWEGTSRFEEDAKPFKERTALPNVDILPEDLATIYYTSGTTGLPKGVLGTNRQYLTNLFNSFIAPVRSMLRRGEEIPPVDPEAPQKSLLLAVPLFHATGSHSFMQVGTATGAKIILMRKWDAGVAAKLIDDEQVNICGGMPFMAMELLESTALASSKHQLEGLSYGGGPCSSGVPSDIRAKFPNTYGAQGYGATELSSAAATTHGEDYLNRPKSTGLPCFSNVVKIVDEREKTLGANEMGEIYIKGVNRTLGYWKNEKATKEVFLDDGYYKTQVLLPFMEPILTGYIHRSGDIGYVDDEGFLFICDRAKDMIIRGGENIASVAVENALFSDQRLLDVAVVPVPDAKLSELVSAVVVVKQGFFGTVTETELISLVAKLMPRHCIPVMVDIRQDTLPRGGTGKTDKKILKVEMAKLWGERKAAIADASRARL
ncbi:hypothetical protein P7C70_g3356, partial [Phenoliferia sp. Uapishka_3]